MSAQAMGYVFERSPFTGTAFTLHLCVADIVNDVHDWEFWLSPTHLAAKARCTRGTASKWLWEAAAMDPPMLEVVEDNSGVRSQHGGKASRFRFLTPDLPRTDGRDDGDPRTQSRRAHVQTDDVRASGETTRTYAEQTCARTQSAHITQREELNKNGSVELNARADHDLAAFEELWERYRRLSVWGPVGTRAAAWKAWCKLSPPDRKRAVGNFQHMVEMKRPTRERAPHASTFLGKSEKGFTCYDDGSPAAAESTELFVDEVLSFMQPTIIDVGEVNHVPR